MMSKSPDRGSFAKNRQVEILQDPKSTEEAVSTAKAAIQMHNDWDVKEDAMRNSPEWRKNNMEYNLLTTDWILEKVRASDVYAQNLYAALCNNDFQQLEVIPILKELHWSCSWRYAGGIIADMQQKGDYIDWYCSGIKNDGYQDDLDIKSPEGYVPESCVTDEIRADLQRIGWVVVDSNDKF